MTRLFRLDGTQDHAVLEEIAAWQYDASALLVNRLMHVTSREQQKQLENRLLRVLPPNPRFNRAIFKQGE